MIQGYSTDASPTTKMFSSANLIPPITPASSPNCDNSIRKALVDNAVDRRSTACRIEESSLNPILLTLPPIKIKLGLKKLTSPASMPPIIRPLSLTISLAAWSPAAAACPTSIVVYSLYSAKAASLPLATIGGPAVIASRQPGLPQ